MAGMQQPPMAITFPSCWLVIYAPSDLPCLLVLQWQGGVFGCWKTQGGQPSTTYRPYSFFSTLVWDHVQWDGFCLSLLKLYIEKSWNLEQLDIYIYIIIYIYIMKSWILKMGKVIVQEKKHSQPILVYLSPPLMPWLRWMGMFGGWSVKPQFGLGNVPGSYHGNIWHKSQYHCFLIFPSWNYIYFLEC